MVDWKSKKFIIISSAVFASIFTIITTFFVIEKKIENNRIYLRKVAIEKKLKIKRLKELELKRKLAAIKADKIKKHKKMLAQLKYKKWLKYLAKERKRKLKLKELQLAKAKLKTKMANKISSTSTAKDSTVTVDAASPAESASLASTTGDSNLSSLLKSGGLGDVQVNAILANLNRESSLNPNADNGAGNQGLAQWGGSRLSSLKSQCNGLGTASCQINFLLGEMKSGINGFNINTFNSFKDVDSANAYFKQSYEGAA